MVPGNGAVGTSWPASARKLAAPMPVTPGVSQGPAHSSVLATRPSLARLDAVARDRMAGLGSDTRMASTRPLHVPCTLGV